MPEALETRRGSLAVPVFLPEATRAAVRSVGSADLRRVGIEGLVVNAFHLLRRPGMRVIGATGGVHRFMDWDGPILSDSGGFQVWSLIRQDPARGVIRDNEVVFREPSTGERWNLTPERVIELQLRLGADIMVCLDDCTDAGDDLAEQQRSVERTLRWARRCRVAFDRLAARRGDAAPPRLFAVVQGGISEALRRRCAVELAAIGFDGYGFGGWPLGAQGELLVEPLGWVAEALPAGAPRHALGLGRPDHVVACAALGYTVFDCSLPTRDARHGRLYAFRPGWPGRALRPGVEFFRTLHVLDPRYRAADVFEFYGALRGRLDRALVAELLERFDLDPTRPVGQLSTGNRRKVGIIQAFVHRPELLILDEPTSGLDPLLQHEFQVVLRRAVSEGATVFLSSHVLPEVEALADRVGILRRGRLVAVARIDELQAQARQRIDFHVAAPADPSIFAGIPEVVSAVAADGVIQVVVEGSVERVIRAAARLEVRRLVTHDADLEDVFLRYYHDQDTRP